MRSYGLAAAIAAVRVSVEVDGVAARVVLAMLRKEHAVGVVSPTGTRSTDVVGSEAWSQSPSSKRLVDVVHEAAHDRRRYSGEPEPCRRPFARSQLTWKR